ncbi:MFS transporter [Photobacterium sp. 2_MG-2023]|uniref:MFS transporter n=1 Tax=Photobacterium sp. 2_MG-2023 TaxID=3062663 RepID=UPI0026E4214C|nr:MFS transporter [Photobacterium sp. 2_MG-2023]MDO6582518.1 MFS transporter [Photobacterium sp. 2_MG-2023]
MKNNPPNPIRALLPLMAILIGNAVAHSLFMISFPIAGRVLGMSDIQTGAVLSLSAFTMLLVAPWWGRYSDSVGCRPAIRSGIISTALFLIMGAALFTLQSSLILSATALFLSFLAIRIFQSIAVAGMMPSIQAHIANVTPEQKRVSGMGLMGATFGIGSLIGGSTAMLTGVAYFPHSMLIIAVLMLLTYWLYLPRINSTFVRQTVREKSAPVQKLPLKTIAPYVLITFVVIFIYGLIQQTTGLRLQDQFSYTAQQALKGSGAMLTMAMGCMALSQVLLSCLTISRPVNILFGGVVLGCIGLAALIRADTYLAMMISMAMTGLAMGLVLPANLALLSQKAGINHQAYAASINIIGKGIGLAAGPLAGAAMYQADALFPVWASLLLFAVLPLFLLHQRQHAIAEG